MKVAASLVPRSQLNLHSEAFLGNLDREKLFLSTSQYSLVY